MKRIWTPKRLMQFCALLFCGLTCTAASLAQTPDSFTPEPSDSSLNLQDDAAVEEPGILPQDLPSVDVPDLQSQAFPYEPAQETTVNEAFADWRQAGLGQNEMRLDDTFRANWIMTDANGRFDGVVSTFDSGDVANMRVYLLNKGRLIKETRADEMGRFRFNSVRPGPYGLIGFGEGALFAFGVKILAYNEDFVGKCPSNVQITAAPNDTTINMDWIRYFAPAVEFRVYGRYVSDDPYNQKVWTERMMQTGAGSLDGNAELFGPARLFGILGLSEKMPDAIPATSIVSHPVSLTEDGRLIGRIHQISSIHGRPVDLRDTRVMLMKNDGVVMAETADNYGVFEFFGVEPGTYSVAAVGEDGLGCIGIEVVNFSGDVTPVDFTMLPSEATGWLNHLATETAYQRVINRPRPQTDAGPQDPGYFPGMSKDPCRRGVFFRFLNNWIEEMIYGYPPDDAYGDSCEGCGRSGCNGGCGGQGACPSCGGNCGGACGGGYHGGYGSPILETAPIESPPHGAMNNKAAYPPIKRR